MDVSFKNLCDRFRAVADKCAGVAKDKAVSLTLLFSLIATPASAVQPRTPDDTARNARTETAQFDPRGLWKTERFDAVVTLEDCPPDSRQELCSHIWWVNPKDREIYEYFGSGDKAPNKITENDVQSLCGMKADITANSTGLNSWKGTLYAPGQNLTITIEVSMPDENTAKLTEYINVPFLSLIKEYETWQRVREDDPRYPRCAAPKP